MKILHVILLPLVFFWVSTAHADEPMPVEELVKLWGVDSSIEGTVANIAAAPDHPDGQFPEPMKEAWRAVSETSLDADLVLKAMIAGIEERLTVEERIELEALLKSPLGVKVTKAESDAQSAGNIHKAAELGVEILQNASSERQSLLYKMIDGMQMREQGLAAGMNMLYALFRGMNEVGSFGSNLGEEDIRALLKQMRPRLEEQLIQTVPPRIAYTYRDISISDLRAYSNILESDVVATIYSKMTDITSDVFSVFMRKFGQDLSERLKEKKI